MTSSALIEYHRSVYDEHHLIIFTELSKDTKLEFKPENTNHSDKFEYEFLDDKTIKIG